MKKSVFLVISMLVVFSMILAACSTATTEAPAITSPTTAPAAAEPSAAAKQCPTYDGDWWKTPYKAEKEWVIGVSNPNLQFPFAAALQKAIEDKAAEMGVKLISTDAGLDTNKELANVENMLAQKIDALLFTGASAEASVAAIEAANKANVPVVQYNGKAAGGDYVSFVGSDQAESGNLLGQWLIDLFKKSGKDQLNGIYLRGVAGQITDNARYDAVKKTLSDAGLADKITFVEQYADYDRAKGQSVTESILQQSTNYDFLIANNDDMVLGALAALDQFGLKGKLPAAGVDGLPEALDEIKKGNLSATIFQNPEGQAAGSLVAAVAYLESCEVPKEILIPFILVTPENVDEVAAIAERVYVK